jgi:hypothetical protein
MTIEELHAEMVATIQELRAEMVAGFTRLENQFHADVKSVEKKLRAEMKSEGKTTRRYFEVMVEKMQESVKLVAEGTAHHTVRLDDHEKRIKRLEGPRRRVN